MATFSATFSTVSVPNDAGKVPEVMKGRDAVRIANLTTSGSSQNLQATGGGDWAAPESGFVAITCDGAVNLHIAASPTAAATAGFALNSGERLFLGVVTGDKIAVINA